MKVTPLSELARRYNVDPRQLERQLQAMNEQPHLRGLVIMQKAPGKRKYVNEAVINLIHEHVERVLADRVTDVEGRVQSLEMWRDECESRRIA